VAVNLGASIDFYGGRDPRSIALYPLSDAARYLRLPRSTLKDWLVGRPYSTSTEVREWPPIIEPADASAGSIRLSFKNLVEAHVLSTLRGRNVSVPAIRQAVTFIREQCGVANPFADVDALSDAKHVYVKALGGLWNASTSVKAFENVLERYLERIDRDEHGIARRLYPFTGERDERSPKLVTFDPLRRFGRPIVGPGVETWVVHSRWRAGESSAAIAEDLDLNGDDVDEALRFEQTAHARRAA